MAISTVNNYGYHNSASAIMSRDIQMPAVGEEPATTGAEMNVGGKEDMDSIEISEEGRLAVEQEKQAKSAQSALEDEDDEEVSESQGGKVAVNESKRARQIAAAKCRDEVQQVIALLHQDMADCKAGLEKGWCDETEIAKVQALLNSAQARLSQVPREAEEELGISEFDLAGLM